MNTDIEISGSEQTEINEDSWFYQASLLSPSVHIEIFHNNSLKRTAGYPNTIRCNSLNQYLYENTKWARSVCWLSSLFDLV